MNDVGESAVVEYANLRAIFFPFGTLKDGWGGGREGGLRGRGRVEDGALCALYLYFAMTPFKCKSCNVIKCTVLYCFITLSTTESQINIEYVGKTCGPRV